MSWAFEFYDHDNVRREDVWQSCHRRNLRPLIWGGGKSGIWPCRDQEAATKARLAHHPFYVTYLPTASSAQNTSNRLIVANTIIRCFLDRTNIGNARLDHLEQDLKLHGLQYNDCLAVLFPFYIAAEIPSNMMMKRTRPSIWLTFIMFFWSASMIAQGFVKNYSGLMATRVFLGVFEGGVGSSIFIAQ